MLLLQNLCCSFLRGAEISSVGILQTPTNIAVTQAKSKYCLLIHTDESELRSLVLSLCRCRFALLHCSAQFSARDVLELIGLGKFGANDGNVIAKMNMAAVSSWSVQSPSQDEIGRV